MVPFEGHLIRVAACCLMGGKGKFTNELGGSFQQLLRTG